MNEQTPPARRFLKLTDGAEELNISQAQAYALVRSGDLSAIQIGGSGVPRPKSLNSTSLTPTARPKRTSHADYLMKRQKTSSKGNTDE